MHRITQEIPRRARVFGYGPFTLYGAAFQKLHLTFALPRRAPTTSSPTLPTLISTRLRVGMSKVGLDLACSAFARHY